MSEWEKTRYLIGVMVLPIVTGYLTNLASSFNPSHGKNSYIMLFLCLCIEVAINIVGIIILFNRNEKSGGHNFVVRAICLSLPSAVRTFVIGWCGLLAFSAIMILLLNSLPEALIDNLYLPMITATPLFVVVYFNILFLTFMVRGFNHLGELEH